jgi:hypothetical protein
MALANARKSLTDRDGLMVSRIFASWNHLERSLKGGDSLRKAA